MRTLKTPLILLFVSLGLFRFQNLQDLQLSFWTALRAGAWRGFLADWGMIAIGVALIAFGGRSYRVRLVRNLGSLLILLLSFGALGEVLHFRYFHAPLDAWVVAEHLGDAFAVRQSAGSLSLAPRILMALLLSGAALLSAFLRGFPEKGHFLHGRRLPWNSVFLFILGISLIGAGEWRRPRSYREGHTHDTSLWVRWVRKALAGRQKDGEPSVGSADQAISALTSSPVDFHFEPQPTSSGKSLLRNWRKIPEETRALRRGFGLPEEGPIHLLFVFIESGRAWEMWHPVLGPRLFPKLNELVRERGVVFSQAYSSAFIAGQTVRGQFSTFCSLYPDPLGPAPTIDNPQLGVNCMAGLGADNGYITTWFNSHDRTFNKKDIFESLHGMQRFFDREYFLSHGVSSEPPQQFGLRDRPFLQATLRELKDISREGRGIFSNILTTTSHHPSGWIPESGITPEEADLLLGEQNSTYRDLASVSRYVDLSVEEFIRGVFDDSDLGARSLVILLGDHSHSRSPPIGISTVAKSELLFRVPVAILSRKITAPAWLATPIHQIDLAPLAASVAGLQGPVTWTGRSPLAVDASGKWLARTGSPWIYPDGAGGAQYRLGDRLCVEARVEKGVECYRVPSGSDPLYWSDEEQARYHLESRDEDIGMRMKEILDSNHVLITHDLIRSRAGGKTAGKR